MAEGQQCDISLDSESVAAVKKCFRAREDSAGAHGRNRVKTVVQRGACTLPQRPPSCDPFQKKAAG